MGYDVTNVSRSSIGPENLDTADANGKLETFSIAAKATASLTDEQYSSKRVQRHVQMGRLRARKTS